MTRQEAEYELQWIRAGIDEYSNLHVDPRLKKEISALDMAITALRPITREQMEKVWRGEWEPGNPICPICGKDKFDGLEADIWADWMPNFCPNCGAPMTDEAVEIIMERLEETT